jgi:hypothetical protein
VHYSSYPKSGEKPEKIAKIHIFPIIDQAYRRAFAAEGNISEPTSKPQIWPVAERNMKISTSPIRW